LGANMTGFWDGRGRPMPYTPGLAGFKPISWLSLSSGKVRVRLTSEHYGGTSSTIDRMSRKTGSGHDD